MLVALVVALTVAALPLASAFAAPATDNSTPPAAGNTLNPRLELAWARVQVGVERVNLMSKRSAVMVDKLQTLIDRAKANGKDVTALQSALDAFKQALKSAAPTIAKINSIKTTHAGFDANGKVTDATQAAATLKEIKSQFEALRGQLAPARKALTAAVKAFRDANPRPTATPSASSG
jgi:hypothetical protein